MWSTQQFGSHEISKCKRRLPSTEVVYVGEVFHTGVLISQHRLGEVRDVMRAWKWTTQHHYCVQPHVRTVYVCEARLNSTHTSTPWHACTYMNTYMYTHSCEYYYEYILIKKTHIVHTCTPHWVTVCVYRCSQIRELWFYEIMYKARRKTERYSGAVVFTYPL